MEILNKIQQELKAPKGQFNSFGKYKYRSCEDILEAVKPLLDGATLILTDKIVMVGTPTAGKYRETAKDGKVTEKDIDIGSRVYVHATAILTLGKETVAVSAFAREPLAKKGMDESQITGTASSYARKYALNGLFCIDDTKDADSTNTHGKEGKQEPQEAPKAVDPYQYLAEQADMSVEAVTNRLDALGFDTVPKILAASSKKLIPILKESK